jgi:hypothetical protein
LYHYIRNTVPLVYGLIISRAYLIVSGGAYNDRGRLCRHSAELGGADGSTDSCSGYRARGKSARVISGRRRIIGAGRVVILPVTGRMVIIVISISFRMIVIVVGGIVLAVLLLLLPIVLSALLLLLTVVLPVLLILTTPALPA